MTIERTPTPATSAMIERLVAARRAAGLTQAEVGARMGSFQAFLSKVENGITSPRLTTLEAYARAVGVRIAWRVVPLDGEPDPDDLSDPETLAGEPGNDLAHPCPVCGHHTLYRPEGWIEGGPAMCANPWCDSNHPAEPTEPTTTGGA